MVRTLTLALLAVPFISYQSLEAQPVNDLCSSVTPQTLAVGGSVVYTGNTVGATMAGDNVPGSGLDNYGIPVVWAAFTTGQCADVALSFCGSPTAFGSQYFWEVLTAQCPADQLVVSSDYNNTECADGEPTIHHYSLPAGTWYYPVWADQSGPIGDYVLTISATACAGSGPANDECGGATAHALANGDNISITGDNTGATDGEGFGYATVWESFTLAGCADVVLDYCGTAFADYANGIYGNCPASTLIAADSTGNCDDGALQQRFSGLAAGTYWIPVLMQPDSAVGTYTIHVSAMTCSGPPANDVCMNAVPHGISVGSSLTITGDNTGATANDGLAFVATWENFSVASCTNLMLDYCGTGFTAYTSGLYTNCPATSMIAPTSTDTCQDGALIQTFMNLPAGTYWIPVLMEPDSALGAYTIHLNASVCGVTPLANDICVNAVQWQLSPGETVVMSDNNTGATDTEGLGYASAWESFTLDSCSMVFVDYCGTGFAAYATGLFADCADTLVIMPNSMDTCIDGSLTETFTALAAGTYWIPVLMQPDSAMGIYVITLVATSCGTIGAPENDECGQAATLTLSTPDSCGTYALAGDNTGATPGDSMPACAADSLFNDVWFSFASGTYEQVQLVLTPGTIVGAGMEVLAACGDTGLICITDSDTLQLDVDAGNLYYVRVFTDNTGVPGTFTLCAVGDISIGVDAVPNTSGAILFPNPGNGDFTLMPAGSASDAMISVLDLGGRSVYSETAQLIQGSGHSIRLAGTLGAGSYFLRVSSKEGTSVVRFTVE
ncbi:MAG: T9SS type A sorting domain-containing protein [Flavobacteriales bacterium]